MWPVAHTNKLPVSKKWLCAKTLRELCWLLGGKWYLPFHVDGGCLVNHFLGKQAIFSVPETLVRHLAFWEKMDSSPFHKITWSTLCSRNTNCAIYSLKGSAWPKSVPWLPPLFKLRPHGPAIVMDIPLFPSAFWTLEWVWEEDDAKSRIFALRELNIMQTTAIEKTTVIRSLCLSLHSSKNVWLFSWFSSQWNLSEFGNMGLRVNP